MDRKKQIQRAKELLECGVLSESTCDAIKADFPELAESEDEKIRRSILRFLQYHKAGETFYATTWDKAIGWLESICPKLSDEDIKKIRSEEYTKGFNDAAFGGKAWKPSEEQMCELNWASKLSPVLETLYNDLKKLM